MVIDELEKTIETLFAILSLPYDFTEFETELLLRASPVYYTFVIIALISLKGSVQRKIKKTVFSNRFFCCTGSFSLLIDTENRTKYLQQFYGNVYHKIFFIVLFIYALKWKMSMKNQFTVSNYQLNLENICWFHTKL